jgi:hypothetical protein
MRRAARSVVRASSASMTVSYVPHVVVRLAERARVRVGEVVDLVAEIAVEALEAAARWQVPGRFEERKRTRRVSVVSVA